MNTDTQIFVFELDGKKYAFPLIFVKEVVAMPAYTPVPLSPEYLVGLANYKNGVLPVYSLEKMLDVNQKSTPKLCLIIYSRAGIIGYGVDAVLGVRVLNNARQLEARVKDLAGGLRILSTLQLGVDGEPVTMLDN
jgi:chemotaxis signal transduction protein